MTIFCLIQGGHNSEYTVQCNELRTSADEQPGENDDVDARLDFTHFFFGLINTVVVPVEEKLRSGTVLPAVSAKVSLLLCPSLSSRHACVISRVS